MNWFVLYFFLVKATLLSFSGLGSLPILRNDLVVKRHLLTDRELNTAVAAGRLGPGPIGLYVVSVGYFAGGGPGAVAGWLALVTPAFLIIPLLRFLAARAQDPRVKSAIGAAVLAGAALLLSATGSLARDALNGPGYTAIAVIALALVLFTRIGTIWIILGSAGAGLIASAFARV